jgi:hypothetical protein
LLGPEDTVDDSQQLARRLLDLADVRQQSGLPCVLGVFFEHLRVAEDLPERRAHVVMELAKGRAGFARRAGHSGTVPAILAAFIDASTRSSTRSWKVAGRLVAIACASSRR